MSDTETKKKQRKPLSKPVLAVMIIAVVAMLATVAWSFVPDEPSLKLPNNDESEPEIVVVSEPVTVTLPDTTTAGPVNSEIPSDLAPPQVVILEANEPEVFQLTLSAPAKKALDELEKRYYSEVRTELLKAQVEEKKQELGLKALTPPEPKPKKPEPPKVIDTPDFLATKLTLKSVIFNPNQTTAWFELDGRAIPVQQGAWIDKLRVYRINKDHVMLIDHTGKTYRKYMPKRKVVLDEERKPQNGSRLK